MYLDYIVIDMRVLVMLSFCGVITVATEFFHEPSSNELKPSVDDVPSSEFGFSIAYQGGNSANPARLVVGAPWHDFVGKVYSCPLEKLSKTKNIGCSVIDMDSLELEKKTKEARNELNPDQYFYFGSSIAATSDYFLTCAPLMTKIIRTKNSISRRFRNSSDFYGACYLHNRTTNKYLEWMDNGVKIENILTNTYNLVTPKKFSGQLENIRSGGLGWTTLADDTPGGHLVVAKTAYLGDILSTHIENPLETTKSLVEDHFTKENNNIMNDYYNTGYGMSTGYFFSESEKWYAISARRLSLKGRIMFMKEINGNLDLPVDENETIKEDYILNNNLGSMFGYALASADINKDMLSELIVGAPAYYLHSDVLYLKELGALHIYIGGTDLLRRSDDQRMCTILGDVENSRFGSAIATNDIDDDNIPEIFVSAPYENSGGVVYVISGYQLKKFIQGPEKHIELSKLTLTQRIMARADDSASRFGFSLQIVKDIDGNGCDELAIGLPKKNSVRLLHCLPSVTASTTLEVVGGQPVKYDATSFTLQVCLNVNISQHCQSLIGNIVVTSSSTGNVTISTPSFDYKLNTSIIQQRCENVIVDIQERKPDQDFTFRTKLELSKRSNENDYKSWAVLSARSELKNKLQVSQRCDKDDCKPDLTYNITWNGKYIDTTTSKNETVTIEVQNRKGNNVSDVYVRFNVTGARVSPPTECVWKNDIKEYMCNLKPIKSYSTYALQVVLNTAEPINTPHLKINAQLGNKFFEKINYEPQYKSIPYLLNTSLVMINGSNDNFTITDVELKNSEVTFCYDHEYYISNDGPVTWLDIVAILEINKEPFIEKVKIPTEMCQEQIPLPDKTKYIFRCKLTLIPKAVTKIIAGFQISKKSIKTDIVDKNLSTSSKITLKLDPTNTQREATSSTQMQFKKVLTMENNKSLIIIIVVVVAILVLLLLTFILYKFGFFKRAEKKKLEVLRESVRKRSIRQASESSKSRKPSSADGNICDIEVVDDCVFQEIEIATAPPSSKDNVMLIKDKQVPQQ